MALVPVNDDEIRLLISRGLLDAAGKIRIEFGTPTKLENGLIWFELNGTSPDRVLSVNIREGGATITVPMATF